MTRPLPRPAIRAGLLVGLAVVTIGAVAFGDAYSREGGARDGGPPLASPPATQDGTNGSGSSGAGSPSLRESWVQTPRTLAALDRGLAWLARQQATSEDGSFPPSGYGPEEKYAPIGVTALATLAFLAAGNAPDRGPWGRQVSRGIDYLLAHSLETSHEGRPAGYIWTEGDSTSKIHGHGFATLALSQAWTMSPRDERGGRIEQALLAAVRVIETSQGQEGGWWYDPQKRSEHEGSTTVCLVQALRAARDCGIRVDVDVIARALGYLQRTQAEDGRFAYMIGEPRFSVALTAAGIATLYAAGVYQGDAIERGITAIRKDLLSREEDGQPVADFPFYERLYLAQAFWQLDDLELYQGWWRTERERILAEQREDGSWLCTDFGDCYATAINCLVLALPEGLLPVFLR